MNFIVTGYDYKDPQALERRMTARTDHMENIKAMKAKGEILFAAAMVNHAGDMCGSTMILEMEDEAAVQAYLEGEAYMIGKVWEDVKITPCKVPDLFRA